MSTLNTVNITNGTDSITVEGAVKGSAKAWVNFNGTGTVAIRASYNVSSITDNGVGDFTVNFTTALADANYSFAGSDNSWGITYVYLTQTTTACRHQFINGSGVTADRFSCFLNYFR